MTFPSHRFREALTALDAGEADVIVTPEAEAAEWAKVNGYRVESAEQAGWTVYEVYPGDRGPASR